jgi:hypothetical protein
MPAIKADTSWVMGIGVREGWAWARWPFVTPPTLTLGGE